MPVDAVGDSGTAVPLEGGSEITVEEVTAPDVVPLACDLATPDSGSSGER